MKYQDRHNLLLHLESLKHINRLSDDEVLRLYNKSKASLMFELATTIYDLLYKSRRSTLIPHYETLLTVVRRIRFFLGLTHHETKLYFGKSKMSVLNSYINTGLYILTSITPGGHNNGTLQSLQKPVSR